MMIIVGVSGGVDSMVLLDKLYKKHQTDLVIAHVNYQKRKDSYLDEVVINEYIKDKDIIFEKLVVGSDSYTSDNFQKQARVIRYNFYRDLAHKYQTKKVYLAHHLDDKIETFLFQKQRTGLYDYYGLRDVNHYQDIEIHRPLLNIDKNDIMDYAKLHNINFHEDYSNKMLIYTRNKIRNQLKSIDINEKKEILSEIEKANEEINCEKAIIEKLPSNVISLTMFNNLSLNVKRRYLFSKIKKYNITLKYLDELIRKIETSRNFEEVINDLRIIKSYQNLYFVNKELVAYNYLITNAADLIKVKKLLKKEYFINIKDIPIEFPYVIRNLNNKEYLEYKEILKKKKIPAFQRRLLPIIEKDKQIYNIWKDAIMHKDIKKILITEDEIIERTKQLANDINEEYKGQRIVLVGLLKGSIPFLAEFMKHLNIDVEVDFMDVSSYHGGTSSTGEVRILKDLTSPIVNKNVILVEDIVDTGRTLNVVKGMLLNRDPNFVKIVSLLDKPEGRVVDIDVDYVGFTIPNEFVIGFGLDYDELYRNLPYIGILREERYM